MSFQSRYGTNPRSSTDDIALARKVLNLAGRTADAAFRSLTLDTLLVRGTASLGGTAVKNGEFYPAFSPIQAFLNTNSTLATGGFAKIPFNAVDYDLIGKWDTTNFNISIVKNGMYMFAGSVNFADNANAADIIVSLFRDGSETFRSFQMHNFNAATTLSFPFVFPILHVTNTKSLYDVRLFNNSGANFTLNGSSAIPRTTWMTICNIGGA